MPGVYSICVPYIVAHHSLGGIFEQSLIPWDVTARSNKYIHLALSQLSSQIRPR